LLAARRFAFFDFDLKARRRSFAAVPFSLPVEACIANIANWFIEEQRTITRDRRELHSLVRAITIPPRLQSPKGNTFPHTIGRHLAGAQATGSPVSRCAQVFKSGCPKDQREQPDWPAGAESNMREKSMITDRNPEAARQKRREEKRDPKPVETEMVEVERTSGQR
jgi:hypothetical protein